MRALASVSMRRSAAARAYAKAGADIIFVEAPETEEEFRRVGGEIDAWLLANMVPTGKSPEIAAERLQAMGFSTRDLSDRRNDRRLRGA